MTARSISVVVPVYNGERFLREALESVAAQTMAVHELIVVDDGSTDASASVALACAGVTLILQANAGPSAARNTGILRASGDAVAFLDADDLWLPEKLERQVAHLEGDVGIVLARHWHRVEPGTEVPPAVQRVIDRDGKSGGIPSGWLVTRAAIESVGLFDERLRLGEDVDWLARARDAGVVTVELREQLLVRRFHGNNLTLQHGPELRAAMLAGLRASVRRKRSGGSSG